MFGGVVGAKLRIGIPGKAGPPNWCSSNQPSHNTPRASSPPPTIPLIMCDVAGTLGVGYRLVGLCLCGALLAMDFYRPPEPSFWPVHCTAWLV